MKTYIAYFFVFFAFLFSSFSPVLGQDQDEVDFFALKKQILDKKLLNQEGINLINPQIKKNKSKHNYEHLVGLYSLAMLCSVKQDKIKYGDSIILTSMKTNDNENIGVAYKRSSEAYLQNHQYTKALDQALISHEYLKKVQYRESDRKTLLTIADIKNLLGEPTKAKALAEEATRYFKWKLDIVDKPRIKTSYIFCLIKLIKYNAVLGLHQENKKRIQDGYDFIKTHSKETQHLLPKLKRTHAYDLYCMGEYTKSIKLFHQAYKEYQNYNTKEKRLWIKFYTGMAYWKLNQIEEAKPYFEEIHQDYLTHENTSIEFRPMFDFFIDYYKENGDRNQELVHLNHYLTYQKKNEKELKLLVNTITTEYDLKTIAEEKERIAKEKQKEQYYYIAGTATILVLIGGLFFLIKTRKKNATFVDIDTVEEKELTEITETSTETLVMENNTVMNSAPKEQQKVEEPTKINYEEYSPIHPKTVDYLLEQLHLFEQEKGFLSSKTRIQNLAQQFNTNEKYVSKIIKVSQKKNFSEYINSLRIQHLKERIDNDDQIQHQKIKDLAKSLGYATPESFSIAFKDEFGKTPSEYFG